MELHYIENKLKEIQQMRRKILEEMKIDHRDSFSFVKAPRRKIENMNDIRMACIMDEFTYHSFDPECNLLQITPHNWMAEMERFRPDIFFIESAWRGKDNLWTSKVAHLSDELIQAVNYCKMKDIPVVFWNKEDPVHFDTFLGTAKLADYVFTTDIDCIKKYKSLLKHEHVYVLPFAAQTKIHNPIEKEERKDRFCFAGAYYKRFPDRARDLETFVDTITRIKELDIYDRNYNNDDPNYRFPKKYKPFIIGTLKADEIDKAYKGYRYHINMNSVKQSQSMCARRIFELLASNTVTVSNYSRAIRNILGDLVVATDDAQRLERELAKFSDQQYYNKYRLLGLRKVLSEHTYKYRLLYLVQKVWDVNIDSKPLKVAVIAKPGNHEQLKKIVEQFNRQAYDHKELILICEKPVEFEAMNENIKILKELGRDDLNSYDCAAFFSNHDYYGKHYLTDMVLAFEYSDKPLVTKSTYFVHDDQAIEKAVETPVYRSIHQGRARKSLINIKKADIGEIIKASHNIDQTLFHTEGISIDEFNYCMNFEGDECVIADDLQLTDTGISMDAIYEAVEQQNGEHFEEQFLIITAEEIRDRISERPGIKVSKEHNQPLLIDCQLPNGHDYLYLNKLYELTELHAVEQLDLYLDVDFIGKFSFDMVVLLLDADQNKIDSVIKPCNRKITVNVDWRAKYVKLGFRASGVGKCVVKELLIGQIDLKNGIHLSKSKALLITDQYPDYSDLYRYAFIHTRLTEYKNLGMTVDVFKCNDRYPKGYYEFNGIDVATGAYEDLAGVLQHYDVILVHFLTEDLWNVIKNYSYGKKILVWIHGSEIQPWWRRQFNYSTQQELESAKKKSELRVNFWKNLFGDVINGVYNLHFIFVSQYFADEVFEDLSIVLPSEKYSIIHNYINNNLFRYQKKDKELRKKILSIRPFSNNKYANDLTVKAILELSKQPFFHELEFRVVGKGDLFQTLVKPLKKFKNVILEEKFLRQEEIAELYQNYGVFLVPTRCDSQGVSRDEAMASGLVPITNNVSAIPEFVDENCGMLVDGEDYKGLANCIVQLYQDPDLFQRLSEAASIRVREQCGIHNTIMKEMALIEGKG